MDNFKNIGLYAIVIIHGLTALFCGLFASFKWFSSQRYWVPIWIQPQLTKLKFWWKSNDMRWSNVKTIKIIVDFFTSTAYHRKSMNIIWKIGLKIWKWIMNLISMNKIGWLLCIFVVAYGSHVLKISSDRFDLAHESITNSGIALNIAIIN